jgi:hypothetical protein
MHWLSPIRLLPSILDDKHTITVGKWEFNRQPHAPTTLLPDNQPHYFRTYFFTGCPDTANWLPE